MTELRVVRPSGAVDLRAHGANMYGCQPCPKCESKFRCIFNNAPNIIDCDDCGYAEPVTWRPEDER